MMRELKPMKTKKRVKKRRRKKYPSKTLLSEYGMGRR